MFSLIMFQPVFSMTLGIWCHDNGVFMLLDFSIDGGCRWLDSFFLQS